MMIPTWAETMVAVLGKHGINEYQLLTKLVDILRERDALPWLTESAVRICQHFNVDPQIVLNEVKLEEFGSDLGPGSISDDDDEEPIVDQMERLKIAPIDILQELLREDEGMVALALANLVSERNGAIAMESSREH